MTMSTEAMPAMRTHVIIVAQVILSAKVGGGTATIQLADSFDQVLTTNQVLAIGHWC